MSFKKQRGWMYYASKSLSLQPGSTYSRLLLVTLRLDNSGKPAFAAVRAISIIS